MDDISQSIASSTTSPRLKRIVRESDELESSARPDERELPNDSRHSELRLSVDSLVLAVTIMTAALECPFRDGRIERRVPHEVRGVPRKVIRLPVFGRRSDWSQSRGMERCNDRSVPTVGVGDGSRGSVVLGTSPFRSDGGFKGYDINASHEKTPVSETLPSLPDER